MVNLKCFASIVGGGRLNRGAKRSVQANAATKESLRTLLCPAVDSVNHGIKVYLKCKFEAARPVKNKWMTSTFGIRIIQIRSVCRSLHLPPTYVIAQFRLPWYRGSLSASSHTRYSSIQLRSGTSLQRPLTNTSNTRSTRGAESADFLAQVSCRSADPCRLVPAAKPAFPNGAPSG